MIRKWTLPMGRKLAQSMRPIRSAREVARMLGMTRQRIYQVEAEALRKVYVRLRAEAGME